MITVTNHASQRWAERFPDLDIQSEYDSARYKLGKSFKKKVKATCPQHLEYCGREFNGRYMLRTKEGIVFVVAVPETIITVLDFRK